MMKFGLRTLIRENFPVDRIFLNFLLQADNELLVPEMQNK